MTHLTRELSGVNPLYDKQFLPDEERIFISTLSISWLEVQVNQVNFVIRQVRHDKTEQSLNHHPACLSAAHDEPESRSLSSSLVENFIWLYICIASPTSEAWYPSMVTLYFSPSSATWNVL